MRHASFAGETHQEIEHQGNKKWKDQIKPFNFYLVGFQALEENGKAVKPLMPFSTDSQKTVYEPFIDYETGEIKEGSHYSKPLSRTIMQYVENPEHKFDGDTGVLERKHFHVDGVVYIGKEANNINEQALEVKQAQVFIDKQDIMRKILELSQSQVEEWGVDRDTFKRIKDRIVVNNDINLNTDAVQRLVVNAIK